MSIAWSTRNTIPILANVLIRAEKSKLALKATDLDLEVNETIAAEVSPGGSTRCLRI
jgi:DNA polymerase-3 subunit beta